MITLKMPVRIDITVVQGDGSSTTKVLIPGCNLTDDGVQISSDWQARERRDGTVMEFTRHSIEWTEVEYA